MNWSTRFFVMGQTLVGVLILMIFFPDLNVSNNNIVKSWSMITVLFWLIMLCELTYFALVEVVANFKVDLSKRIEELKK